ncbi:MAG TPA: hypothetical protein VER39_06745 [Nocardioidaceae bacterium]|nr:hypothetical protein [Nocardioidaceae bacterium]
MAFTIRYDDGSTESFDDEDRFIFDTHGHLVVFRADGPKRVYADHAWTFVETGASAVDP